jgi:hypothetical protein
MLRHYKESRGSLTLTARFVYFGLSETEYSNL